MGLVAPWLHGCCCSVTKLCPTLCNPMDCSHPFMGFSIQASPFMGFSGQAHWRGLPFPSPGDLPTQGSNLGLLRCRHTLYQLSHQGSALLVPGAEQTDWSGSRGGTRRFTRVSFNFFGACLNFLGLLPCTALLTRKRGEG